MSEPPPEVAYGLTSGFGALPWLAHTLDAYAHMLLRRVGLGGADKARGLLDNARTTFRVAESDAIDLMPSSPLAAGFQPKLDVANGYAEQLRRPRARSRGGLPNA